MFCTPTLRGKSPGRDLFRFLALLLLLCLLCASPSVLGAQPDFASDPTAGLARKDARIRNLEMRLEAGMLKADFRMTGAFIKEVREHIDSGLPLTFTYRIELYKKRKHWFDLRLVNAKIETRVHRDTLAGRYELTRFLEGEKVANSTTKDQKVMRTWMSEVNNLDLIPLSRVPLDESQPSEAVGSEKNHGSAESKKGKKPKEKKKVEEPDPQRLYLRVKAKIKDEVVFFFIPWDFETDWTKLVLPISTLEKALSPRVPERKPAKANPNSIPQPESGR